MPYLVETKTDKAEMVQPFGCRAAFTPDLVAQADRLEIWGSSANDPGDDWCEYILKLGDQELAKQRHPGF